MGTKLYFSTDRGPFVIELLENEFVQIWQNHFQYMTQLYALRHRYNMWPCLQQPTTNVEEIAKSIVDTMEQINGLDYVSALPESCTVAQLMTLDLDCQALLNRLHRYAVIGTELRDRWTLESPGFNWIPYENQEFMYLINLLNQSIHRLEDYVVTPRRQRFDRSWNTLELVFDASRYQDVDVYQDHADVEIPKHFEKYLQTTGADVWIKKDLLGKDFVTAFFDHDDAAQFDIRPPPMFSGGIQITLNQGREQLFNDLEFRQWLGRPVSNHHGSYPIGNIISGKENLTVRGRHIQSLELIRIESSSGK